MTVEEMRKKIKEVCCSHGLCSDYPLCDKTDGCWNSDVTDEEIKENYKLMFGKEGSKIKNEFDFNELKAGYAIKVPAYKDELLVAIPNGRTITFYSKRFNNIVRKESILMGSALEEYIPIEVYGLSSNDELFDPSTRPLLWKKENMNFKIYKIGNLSIQTNYRDGYKSEEKEPNNKYNNGFLYFKENNNMENSLTIRKTELNDVINALTEIRDFIKED